DRHALGLARDPGVPRRAIELVAERRAGDGPAERMLAPARSDDEYPHLRPPALYLPRRRRRAKEERSTGRREVQFLTSPRLPDPCSLACPLPARALRERRGAIDKVHERNTGRGAAAGS